MTKANILILIGLNTRLIQMRYLICERCFGYYELQTDESPEDFESCECGGYLEFIEDMSEFHRNETVLETKYICPNIYCAHKKPLNKGEDCPECGSSVSGSGFKESMALFRNNSEINLNKSNQNNFKCPNSVCVYEGLQNSVNCLQCETPLENKEKINRPSAFGLVSIKGNGEIQKGDLFYRNDEID